MKKIFGLLAAIILSSFGIPQTARALGAGDLTVASFEEVMTQTVASPAQRIAYGTLPQQFGNLRVPAGAMKHPVVMLIHGGCWLADYDLSYMEALTAAITAQGYATWNIEFRRLGDDGGGWPGTFTDVRDALQFLNTLAPKHSLDLSRVIVLGHSSGGQLAMWLAAESGRHGAARTTRANEVSIKAIVSLAGITNLRAYRQGPPGSCHSAVDELLGGSPSVHADRYAKASPIERLPLGVRQFILQGRKDHVVDLASATRYSEAARKAGDTVQLIPLDGGHFDAVMAQGPAFQALEKALSVAR